MRIDFWLTNPGDVAGWASARTPTALSMCHEDSYNHMVSSGWIKVGTVEVSVSHFGLEKDDVVAAAKMLGEAIDKARMEFGVRIEEMEAARANLLSLTYDPTSNFTFPCDIEQDDPDGGNDA